MEARLIPKLYKYMEEKLHPDQTGFVPGLGIHINQMRLDRRSPRKVKKQKGSLRVVY